MNRLRKHRILATLVAGLSFSGCLAAGPGDSACPPDSGVALQVLGSGGPVADDGRASSSYLVWIDGKARIMVDTGGGSFLRFGEARARFEDLYLIALSHFHTDHSADLPALLKSGYFSDREEPLPVSGPAAGGTFPGLRTFLRGLLSPGEGAYGYLSGYLDGSDGLVLLEPLEVDHSIKEAQVIMDRPGLKVTALGVPHGIVPAVAYRVEAGNHTIVFGADQDGSSEAFLAFASKADVLVSHMAIPEHAGRGARNLHATPTAIGKMASEAMAARLLLSHFMARSLADLGANVDLIDQRYAGEIITAVDHACLVF